jgi:hypothetical protein
VQVGIEAMTTLSQVLEAALELPREEQQALIVAIQEHQSANIVPHSKARQLELVEYALQAALDVKSGKLKPRSVAEIMNRLDDPMDEESA